MFLLLTDETNIAPAADAKFFVYGWLILDLTKLPALDDRIAATRKKFGYKAGDTLQFDTNVRPKHLKPEDAAGAKNEVLQACIECECKFIAHVVLHAISRNEERDQIVRWAANTVIGKFNYFLERQKQDGLVVVDRQPDGNEFAHLVETFSHGLSLEDGEKIVLSRVRLFGSTCINASHASSAMDIALGSFRYCINVPKNVGAAHAMLQNISAMIWCEREGEKIYPFERGLVLRPKEVAHPPYRAEYDALTAHFNQLLKA